MIVINADDWGRSRAETDASLSCHRGGRIHSVSAMVFMQDSERAADLARENGLEAGLHLNLSQRYNSQVPSSIAGAQERIVRFLTRSKYALLVYHPGLRREFKAVFQDQLEEFLRLYGKPPSHLDGHQHRHLCANMLLDEIIPRGQRVRRNFSFWAGEKGVCNRTYRALVDRWLARRYRLADFFFSLGQCLHTIGLAPVAELAKVATVELMTHPYKEDEYAWLMSHSYLEMMRKVQPLADAMPPPPPPQWQCSQA